MDKQEIFDSLTALLNKSLDIDPSSVSLDSTLDSLGIDSIDGQADLRRGGRAQC